MYNEKEPNDGLFVAVEQCWSDGSQVCRTKEPYILSKEP